jgi:hypothetical protein
MFHSLNWRSLALLLFPQILLCAPSPTLAASLFICDVPETSGGCVNGTISPEGFVTFDFSGFTDSFVGGAPVSSPVQALETGTDLPDLGLAKIGFSFFWLAGSAGTDTSPQTIFFTQSDGRVSDVLNYTYSVAGGAGSDFLNLFGYVISAEAPVTTAQLAADGIVPTGFASASGLLSFPSTDITSTFQPGVPELPSWELMLLGFAGLGFVASLSQKRCSRSLKQPDKSSAGGRPGAAAYQLPST